MDDEYYYHGNDLEPPSGGGCSCGCTGEIITGILLAIGTYIWMRTCFWL